MQAELEENLNELRRMSAAELSSLRDHHSLEVVALQHRMTVQDDEHEQQMLSLTARHAEEVWGSPAQSKDQPESSMLNTHRPGLIEKAWQGV